MVVAAVIVALAAGYPLGRLHPWRRLGVWAGVVDGGA